MADIAFFVGALVPTFLISRLGLWLTRQWPGGVTRLITVHGVSLLLTAFVGGMGMADGGAFAGAEAAMGYALPQAVWLIVDLIRHRAPQPSAIEEAKPASDGPSDANKLLLAVAGVALAGVIVAVLWSQNAPPQPEDGPWNYSWEQETEAPAEPAAPQYQVIEGGLVEPPADPAAPALDAYSDAELERLANEPTQEQERSGAFDDIISEAQTPPP